MGELRPNERTTGSLGLRSLENRTWNREPSCEAPQLANRAGTRQSGSELLRYAGIPVVMSGTADFGSNTFAIWGIPVQPSLCARLRAGRFDDCTYFVSDASLHFHYLFEASKQAMATVVSSIRVKDYATWKPVFELAESLRNQAGITNARVFRSETDGNDILLMMDVADETQARQFLTSNELREAMQNGGVISPPRIGFLNIPDK